MAAFIISFSVLSISALSLVACSAFFWASAISSADILIILPALSTSTPRASAIAFLPKTPKSWKLLPEASIPLRRTFNVSAGPFADAATSSILLIVPPSIAFNLPALSAAPLKVVNLSIVLTNSDVLIPNASATAAVSVKTSIALLPNAARVGIVVFRSLVNLATGIPKLAAVFAVSFKAS